MSSLPHEVSRRYYLPSGGHIEYAGYRHGLLFKVMKPDRYGRDRSLYTLVTMRIQDGLLQISPVGDLFEWPVELLAHAMRALLTIADIEESPITAAPMREPWTF